MQASVKTAGVREHDGYEVFYGLASSTADPRAATKERDSYDIFYGIKGPKQERKGSTRAAHPAPPLSARGPATGGRCSVPQLRLSVASGEATGAGAVSGRKPKGNAAPPQQAIATSVPAGASTQGKPTHTIVKSLLDEVVEVEGKKCDTSAAVLTFSLATPAPSFAPPVEMPESVQLYSMATPSSSFVPPIAA